FADGINARGQIVGSYNDAHGEHGFVADPVHGNSAAGDPSPDPAAATPSVVLMTVPVAQLTPTPLPPVSGPHVPRVQAGGGRGGPFIGATTAVLTVPGMPLAGQAASGADGNQTPGVAGNDLFTGDLANLFTTPSGTIA